MGKINKKLIAALGIILIKGIYSTLYIDLKYDYISDGIYVHHGILENGGSYRMYLGEENPLERVNFGTRRMYPPHSIIRKDYQLIVETFEKTKRKFAIIRSYEVEERKIIKSEVLFFELGNEVFIDIKGTSFMREISGPVLLSVDIGPKIRHPYILKKVIESGVKSKIEYTAISEFDNMKFDGVNGPIYKLGSIYDSSRPVVVGYTKMIQFVGKCESVLVESVIEPNKVIIQTGLAALVFEVRPSLGSTVWYLVEKPSLQLLENSVQRAINNYTKIEDNKHFFLNITLDISEQVTPALYGIEKTEGTIGEWRYTMYEVKREFKEKLVIRSILDMSIEYVLVFKVKTDAFFTSVEVFRSISTTFVIVTSYSRSGLMVVRDIDVFEKKSIDFFYMKIDEPKRTVVITDFQKKYPIKVRVNLHEKPTAIYDLVNVEGPLVKFGFYALKRMDERGVDLYKKYTLSDLVEVNPFETGNVPFPRNIKKYRTVREGISTFRFLIRNSIEGFPIDPSHYEIYPILQNNKRQPAAAQQVPT